ncbi:solute carrier family 12 member 8 [Aplochiton taeniatus]
METYSKVSAVRKPHGDNGAEHLGTANGSSNPPVYDLFHEEAQGSRGVSLPWWKVRLFVWEPVLFGTWDGVFTTCMINIFGVVVFLRSGFLVGNTGVPLGMFLVSLVTLFALATVMSGIGVCKRVVIGSGGVYAIITTVLGGRVGGAVGLLYVFGSCVAVAMYITGFSESIAELLDLKSEWLVRAISMAVVLCLVGVNLAGVKWIVRLQLLLLAALAVATLDFVTGSFTHLDPENGFVGYSAELLRNNTLPDYSSGQNFFTVFGVFFPCATGVMSGFNMSADLQKPDQNIPLGTLAAVFTSWFLYLVFVFLLGAICTRDVLHFDFLIAEKVSICGFLFLAGLYISSLASCMGGLYGAPRILQCIAQERVIPALGFLARGRGPNNTPIAAICLTSLLTMAFIFIGKLNVLAPIVTINFMVTYGAIDYSYFSLAMAYDLQSATESRMLLRTPRVKKTRRRPTRPSLRPLIEDSKPGQEGRTDSSGTLLEFAKDMTRMFPAVPEGEGEDAVPCGEDASGDQNRRRSSTKAPAKQTLIDSFGADLNCDTLTPERSQVTQDPGMDPPACPGEAAYRPQEGQWDLGLGSGEERLDRSLYGGSELDLSSEMGSISSGAESEPGQLGTGIKPIRNSIYEHLCNRWLSFIGAASSFLIMFVIDWIYALINIGVVVLLLLYIGQTNPGLPPGAAYRFSLCKWIKSTVCTIGRSPPAPTDQMIVSFSPFGFGMETKQLTEENHDFASRKRFHQSSIFHADSMGQPKLK